MYFLINCICDFGTLLRFGWHQKVYRSNVNITEKNQGKFCTVVCGLLWESVKNIKAKINIRTIKKNEMH